MNMPVKVEYFKNPKNRELTTFELDELARELDAIKQEVLDDIGEKDAQYIRRVYAAVRYASIAGRACLFAGWFPPAWVLGTGLLSFAKIMENMELGHNVMHGQYDWMNDPKFNGASYEWDTVGTSDNWRQTHNFKHHTYTNIVGKDHDVGYGILRVTEDQKWEVRHLANIPLALQLMFFFQWYVGVQNLHLEDALVYKTKTWKQVWADAAEFRKKETRQVLKAYVFFTAIATINFIPVLSGNALANVILNLWSSAVIFNGHFTEDAETFEADNTENESKAEWYLRQIRGSSNFTGGKWMHFMSGNLSHQIEHHLFPDMPANRYEQVAPQIRALCAEYGVNYNEANFMKQFGTVWVALAKCSLPNDMSAQLAQGWTNLKAKLKVA